MTGASDRGLVVWLTGLPSSGKSTLAGRVAEKLRAQGVAVVVLDSDEVRASLRPVPSYEEAGRDAYYETLARLAALIAVQGCTVLVPATAHRRAYRARARALFPAFLEVWVDTPLAECVRRDAKGLYARARQQGLSSLPGVDAAYEPPDHAELVIHPEDAAAAETLLGRIQTARLSNAPPPDSFTR